MVKKILHSQILKKKDVICHWYDQKLKDQYQPIYSSYDIRESLHHISCVDGNIFPAGFNNICPADKEVSDLLFDQYLKNRFPDSSSRIVLLTEEHTQNPYYWNNVACIQARLAATGRAVKIAFPRKLAQPLEIQNANGQTLQVLSGFGDEDWFKEFNPQLIVSNNDFSQPLEEWASSLNVPIEPPRGLGWHQRKKHLYFKYYNNMAQEFADLIEVPPQSFQVETELFGGFDINNEENRNRLADRVDLLLERLRTQYQERQINQDPFLFIKNNSGTYGLGVITVHSGNEVRNWSYKSRKRLKAAKGGRDIYEVILQEGIPSIVKSEESTAEPVIYMVGSELAGGFLRTHREKSEVENLNSPGAVYKRLCIADLMTDASKCMLENVYGWVAKLGALAIGREASELAPPR